MATLRERSLGVSDTKEFAKLNDTHCASQAGRQPLLDIYQLEDRAVRPSLEAGHVVSRDLRSKGTIPLMVLGQFCCWIERHWLVGSHDIIAWMWVHH